MYAIEKDSFPPGYCWLKSQLPEVQKDLDFWIAWSDDKMAGFLASQPDGGFAHIENLAVLSAYRGQGVATKLIEACCKYFKHKGLKKSSLHVYVENPAQTLYFKLGFRPFSITRGERKTMKMVRVL